MSQRVRYSLQIAALTAAYFGAARLGLLAAVVQPVVSSAWPPSGVALAALLLLGVRLWPGIALGAFLLNWTAGVSAAGAAGIAVGNTLAAVAATWLLERVVDFRPSLERVRDVIALVVVAALASTALSATIGVASLWASGAVAPDGLRRLWFVWWSGDALGDLLVAPLLLTWARAALPAARRLEGAAVLAALLLLTALLVRSPLSYVYAVFPVVVWAGLRFGSRGASTATALVAALTIWYTVRGLGPFVASTSTENLALLQTFLALTSVTGLVLAAGTTERGAAEAALRIERERAAESLRQREALLGAMFEQSAVGIAVADRSARFIRSNRAFQEMIGYDPEELTSLSYADIAYAEDLPQNGHEITELARGARSSFTFEKRFCRKDGRVIWAHVTASALPGADGTPELFVGMVEDVTARKQTEADLDRHRAQLRGLAARLEAARESERARIAREIHDELGQALTALKIDVVWLKKRVAASSPELVGKLDDMAAIIDSTAQDIQRVAAELRPSVLDELGLRAAIEWEAREFATRTGIECRVELPEGQATVDASRATAVFRIFQEALTNVARHAAAMHVLVRLDLSVTALELTVQDDGRGIREGALLDSRSLGLLGMRERAGNFQGHVTITGVPGAGTTLTLSMPSGA